MGSWKIIPGIHHYFVTSTIVGWIEVFSTPESYHILVDALQFAVRHKGLRVHGYVLMPNHFHSILSAQEGRSLSGILRDVKRHTSSRISEFLRATHQEKKLRRMQNLAAKDGRGNWYKVWQEGFHPIALYSRFFFVQKLEYMHYNPVKKGFVRRPEDWLYSSARNYCLGDDSLLKVDRLF